ncbi:hypothetical protein [Paenibacillus sp. A3M_27_13]|uniref:hypothetical protein n=1 Tax=Paenibacillus sp. A3M_27_13 TaxID=2962029 RepID=UPI0020B71BF5|nr:hypothetical protein [Paenibacillus sp. A3M_27_13]MCP3746761.1 hypothetical protein [Paenibacillus sp. A3M_27_13]
MKWKEPTFGATPMLKALTTANAHRKAQAFDLAAEQKKQKLNYPSWSEPWMRKYKEDWYIAKANGDEVGMRTAQKLAEGLRSKLREMEKMPKAEQEQMQKETVCWMEGRMNGDIKKMNAAEERGKALRGQAVASRNDSEQKSIVEDNSEKRNEPSNKEKNNSDKSPVLQRDDAIKKAIKITASFEGSGYANIAGNSDDQGLSLGILQWNIGQGTLQPMLISFVNKYNNQAKEIFGQNYTSLAKALQGSKQDQMNWARSINDNHNKIKKVWKEQLIAMCNTKEFQEIQNKAMDKYIKQAYSLASTFNLKTERGLALAFDIAVQNWACTSSRTKSINQKIKSGNLSEQEALKLIAQGAVDKSSEKNKDDVKSRKFTIVNGIGTVHGKSYNLQRDFDLTNKYFK